MATKKVKLSEQHISSLHSAMCLTELLTRPSRGGPHHVMEMLVGQIDGLKVHIQFDEHPPPHFSVRCSEGVARFNIDTGERLLPDRDLRKYDRDVRDWHKGMRLYLIDRWNKSRPSDCPVGPIRVPDA